MAIVNHTGAIAASETWAVTDEHHITGGVSLNDGVVVTIDPGVTVYFDGNFTIFWRTGAGNVGTVDYNGTEVLKIMFRSDSTAFPRPAASDYVGIIVRNTKHSMDWTQVSHADFFIRILPDADDANTWVHINNCACINSEDVFENNSGTAVTNTQDNFWTIDGFYCPGAALFLHLGTIGFTGDNLWQNMALGQICNPALLHGIHKSYSKIIAIDGWLNEGINLNWLKIDQDQDVGKAYEFSITNFFAKQGCREVADGGAVFHMYDFFYRNTNPIIIQNGVMEHCNRGIGHYSDQGEAFTFQNIDFIENCGRAMYYRSALSTLVLDSCYMKNNRRSDYLGTEQVTHQGNQWYDVNDAQSPTNNKATPLFPLDVENIAEGAPDNNSITITYDAKEGSVAGKRLLGIPFIKYGTTSGALDHIAGNPPWDADDRLQVFAKWTTAFGSFATLNHSITLNNLKPGTTYYYKCCFIDPLGRIAEGAEGTFDTTGSSIVRRDVSPSFSIRRT